MNKTIDEINDLFANRNNSEPKFVPQQKVLSWLNDNNIDVLGAAYALIFEADLAKRIIPPLEFLHYHKFLIHYFDRCIRENPESEWADSNYTAAWSLVNWFRNVWKDQIPRSSELKELKQWLEGLYINGDDQIRRCIVDGTLEHLFENRRIAAYFRDWKHNEILSTAYNEAKSWGDKHLVSP
jgi:hypothetical protein